MRTTFAQFRQSNIAEELGHCQTDIPFLLGIVNQAIQRLVFKNRDRGFWGSSARMAFNVAVDDSITGSRDVARISDLAVCTHAIPIQNGFYEFLEFGNGLWPKPPHSSAARCGPLEALDRGVHATQRDIDGSPPQGVRVYLSDIADIGKRIMISGLDANGLTIRSMDGPALVNGFFLTLDSPFVDSGFQVTAITGVQKDLTVGDVTLFQVDLATGAEVQLSRYAPNELTGAYRRYLLTSLNRLPQPIKQVEGIAKLEFVPVQNDTDYLLIGNLEALREECKAIYYGRKETPADKAFAKAAHAEAINLLNDELDHYQGRNKPAVAIDDFETHSMRRAMIGRMM